MMYYMASALLRPGFRHYRHHRPLTLAETWPWMRAFVRKLRFARAERGMETLLATTLSGRYFLVPLQVHNDAQIHTHSEFPSVGEFIEHLIVSFARNAPADVMLVIKHHPMDRGYHDYTALIAKAAAANEVGHRVRYLHDQHLPTLLEHARGVVVINSTVGLSALHHNKPLKVCGKALYDIEGLTYQRSIDAFWSDESLRGPNAELFARFQSHLIQRTQLNGNFYKRLRPAGARWALAWHEIRPSPHGRLGAELRDAPPTSRIYAWLRGRIS
jgi:capsular polysaccharide export protein